MNTKLLNIGVGMGIVGLGMYFVGDIMSDRLNIKLFRNLDERNTILKAMIDLQNSEIEELKARLEKLEGK